MPDILSFGGSDSRKQTSEVYLRSQSGMISHKWRILVYYPISWLFNREKWWESDFGWFGFLHDFTNILRPIHEHQTNSSHRGIEGQLATWLVFPNIFFSTALPTGKGRVVWFRLHRSRWTLLGGTGSSEPSTVPFVDWLIKGVMYYLGYWWLLQPELGCWCFDVSISGLSSWFLMLEDRWFS